MDIKKITPLKPEQLPTNGIKPPTTLPTANQQMVKTLLNRLKEASTWAGLAIIAQFLPIGVEELQVVWEAVTALAAVAAMFIPEGKPQAEDNNG